MLYLYNIGQYYILSLFIGISRYLFAHITFLKIQIIFAVI